ncbi:MAG: hypothetical protein EB127_05925 [Alphaproteobacteria bacterium]|nr:hypothetical protein [Alphaproteobacteria bacterium]
MSKITGNDYGWTGALIAIEQLQERICQLEKENQELKYEYCITKERYGKTKAIVYDCWKQGMTCPEIVKTHKIGRGSVRSACKSLGIKLKTTYQKLEENRLNNQRQSGT